MGDVLGAWWFWAGIVAIGALVGLLFYVRKQGEDD